MTRIVCTTRIDEELIKKARSFAWANGYRGANDTIELALKLYFKLQSTQIFEKELPNGKYQIVTIGNGHTCLDYVDKRILIDSVSDTEHLITDGYYLAFEV